MKNVYQIKMQCQLKGNKRGTIIFPGLVIASTQQVGVELTREKIKDQLKLADVKEYDLKLLNCSRMKCEFIIHEPEAKKPRAKKTITEKK